MKTDIKYKSVAILLLFLGILEMIVGFRGLSYDPDVPFNYFESAPPKEQLRQVFLSSCNIEANLQKGLLCSGVVTFFGVVFLLLKKSEK